MPVPHDEVYRRVRDRVPTIALESFDREVIPERRMHAEGSGAHGTFTVTHDITRYTKAKIFPEVGKKTDLCVRFSTVAGERGVADAERDIRGFAFSSTPSAIPARTSAAPATTGISARTATTTSSRVCSSAS